METPEERTQRDAHMRQQLAYLRGHNAWQRQEPCMPPYDDTVRQQAWMAGYQDAQDGHAAR